MLRKNWVTCGENSMALVGFLLAPQSQPNQPALSEPVVSKECWIMGKTAYCEGASKHCKQWLQDRL